VVPGWHFAVAKHLTVGNLANWCLVGAYRSSCLKVGVLAAGMTRRTRWGEAYQTLHSTDCNRLVTAPDIAYCRSLLKNALRVPLHIVLHLHTRTGLRCTLTRCHHDQRLRYRRVSLRTEVGRRYWWSNRVGTVVDLTWLF
jgi:hypothetical protein